MLHVAPHPPHCQPEIVSLLSRIEEKALRREIQGFRPAQFPQLQAKRRNGSASGPANAGPVPPLVCNAISDRTPPQRGELPPWCSVPTTPTTYYQAFEKDIYVCRSFQETPPPDSPKGTRSAIFEFSDKSRSNLRHVCNNSGHHIKSQFCLTYHEKWPTDGRQVKEHLRRWIKSLRRNIPDVKYLWVLEFQTKRGAPHFHVFLGTARTPEIHAKLAEAWVQITEGTESQLRFHRHPCNWIPWKMQDSSYVMKQYASKKDQKEVPAQYHNVGRFWGHSRNMQPVGMIVEPSIVARFAAMPGQWDEQGLVRFIDRTLRRFHEKSLNFNRKTGERRKGKKRKSPLTRGRGELPGAFRVPFGSQLLFQIMNYVAMYGPDPGTLRRKLQDEIPF